MVSRTLGPGEAYFLSRYHTREVYDVEHSLAAGVEEGIFNKSGGSHPVRSLLTPKGEKRVCDMTANRFSLWRRSLCSSINFGSFDAYVLRIDRVERKLLLYAIGQPARPLEIKLFSQSDHLDAAVVVRKTFPLRKCVQGLSVARESPNGSCVRRCRITC